MKQTSILSRLEMTSAVLALVSIAALPAAADTLDIRKADNAVSVDFGATYLDYAETQSGANLDTEKGWLPTVNVGASLLSSERASPVLRNLFLRVDGRASVGPTAYDGSLYDTNGNTTAYQGSTDDRIYSVNLQVGRAITLTHQLMLTPFVEIGYRHWNRDLLGTYGYSETYSNGVVMGGMMAQYSPVARWVFTLSAAGGTTIDSGMTTGGETFNLSNAATWQVKTRIGYLMTDRLEVNVSGEFQHFSYGASPVDGSGYYEPDSTTDQTTALVGVSYHFF